MKVATSKLSRVADHGRWGEGGTLAVCGGRLVRVGGVKDAVFSKHDGGTLAVCGGRLAWIGGVKDVVFSKEVKELREGDGPSCQTCW